MRERYASFLDRIARVGPGNDHESFEVWAERAQAHLPNFPECVLRQWIHRHWPEVFDHWAWLDLRRLSFHRDAWTTDRVVREAVAVHYEAILERARSDEWLDHQSGSWNLERLRESGTWPVPPIILDNRLELRPPDGYPLPLPFTLVEGHRRLSYFLALHRRGFELQSVHAVWVATPDPKYVRKRWPP